MICQGACWRLIRASKSGLQRSQFALNLFSPGVRSEHQEDTITGIFKRLCYGVRGYAKNKEDGWSGGLSPVDPKRMSKSGTAAAISAGVRL